MAQPVILGAGVGESTGPMASGRHKHRIQWITNATIMPVDTNVVQADDRHPLGAIRRLHAEPSGWVQRGRWIQLAKTAFETYVLSKVRSASLSPTAETDVFTAPGICVAEGTRAIKRVIVGSLLGIAFATHAQGETLDDALRMAKQGNASIAMAADSAAAAWADVAAAERSRLPTLGADASWSRLAHSPMLDMQTPQGRLQSPAIFRDDQMKSAGATILLPLYTSGRLSSAIAASRAQADAAESLANGTVLDIQLTVVTAYLDVLRARAAVGVAENRVRALTAHARTVDALYEQQGVPKTDRLAVEVVLENARADALQAQNRVRTVEAYYNDLLGQPLNRVPDLAEPSTELAVGHGDLKVLTEEAWDRRPELKALEAQREALTESAKMVRAETLPQFGVRAGWQHVETQILDRSDIASVGVGFEWKLFDGGQTAARVSSMRFRARAVQRQWEEARNSISREVDDALRGLSDAKARWETGTRAVAASEENLKLATRLYETGLATNTVVLDATAGDAEAHLREAAARYDVALSNYRIRHALGRL